MHGFLLYAILKPPIAMKILSFILKNKERFNMPNLNSMKSDNNNKKEDGKFKKVNKKHDPQAESTRIVFGEEKKPKNLD
jgi:hypothetical protein